MTSSILEVIIFSLPSLWYLRRARRRGGTSSEARAVMGWRTGRPADYTLAVVVTALLLPVTYLALRAASAGLGASSGHVHVSYGQASNPTGYLAIALLATAEEILFRGFIGGIMIRRYGFAVGNTIQAFAFLAPHLLLLLVSTALWPLLPVQLLAGWTLGLLRWRSSRVGPSSVAHVAANVLAPLLLG